MSRLARVASLSLVACLLAGAALPAQAQDKRPARPRPAPVDERSARVDEALRLSNLRDHLAAIRTRLQAFLDASSTGYDTKQWVTGSFKTAYAPEAYTKPIRQALLDNYDADAMARVLLWYRSPVGRKISRLETAAQVPNQGTARKTYLASLENKQPSEDRLVLVFRIDEGSRASDSTAAALRSSINGWNLGIQQVVADTERQRMVQIESVLTKYRAEFRDVIADDVLSELMYTYREATDAELRAYAEFLESDAGKWFFRTTFKAQETFFEKATEQVAEDFVNTVLQKQTTRPPVVSGKPAPIAPLPIPPSVRRPPPG
jgi:hypothetical protein